MRILKRKLELIQHDDAIYFAGLFDGEGCVGLYERKTKYGGPGAATPYFSIGLSIANTNVEVVEHIKRTCGGNLGTSTRIKIRKDGKPGRKLYRWGAQARESYHILKQVLPFLIVKREQAMLAIEFYESNLRFINHPHPGVIGKLRHTDAEILRRREYVQRMKLLKQV